MNWLAAALDCIAADEKAVLVTVAEAKGSTPRESGAKMLVRARDIVGSVGGGQLELLAIDAARRMMADKATRPDLMRYSLGPDLGQCCGGAVRLLLEPLRKTDRRWLTQWQTQVSNPEARLLLTSTDGEIAFRHELARTTVEEHLSPARRLALHRAVLLALAERGTPDLARLAAEPATGKGVEDDLARFPYAWHLHNHNTIRGINAEHAQLVADLVVCGVNDLPGDPIRSCYDPPQGRERPPAEQPSTDPASRGGGR